VVSHVVLLDAGPLGIATNPKRARPGVACAPWIPAFVTQGTGVMVPEMADADVGRECQRANKVSELTRLDALARLLAYLPISTAARRQVAVVRAQAISRASRPLMTRP
jgi:hypothetical protein